MPCKCNTSDRRWNSFINREFEGTIEVGMEAPGTGDFGGFHHGHGQQINGNCGAVMTIHMPAGRPQFLYRGRFTNDKCQTVIGTRTRLATLEEAASGVTVFTDDWVATKPTTFTVELEAPPESEQEPSAGRAADETPSGE